MAEGGALPGTPADVRTAIRDGRWSGPTSGLAPGHLQVNLIVMPAAEAPDFVGFCARNPVPCPLLEVTAPGDVRPRWAAPSADLRTDLPRYWVFDDGRRAEVDQILDRWSGDSTAFLIGCSFSFEAALLREGVPLRHAEQGTNVPMYRTTVRCRPSGRFSAPLVVSMRPIPERAVDIAIEVGRRFPHAHGRPVHIGSPRQLGIADLDRPDFGEPVAARRGDVPVFWACGVTAQLAALSAEPERLVAHAPGHMLVTDRTEAEGAARAAAVARRWPRT